MTRQPGTGAINALWGRTLAAELYRLGVRHACISPGHRNAPLSMAMAHHNGFRIHTHIDERSGAFFALGIAKATGIPAVLLCTSGTAAVNFYPAVVEAYYSGTPLIVLTADRPPELRHIGANQTIDQIKLFGDHVCFFAEVTTPDLGLTNYLRRLLDQAYSKAVGVPAGPVHLNFPLREPLTPGKDEPPLPLPDDHEGPGAAVQRRSWPVPDMSPVMKAVADHRRGAIVVGPMPPGNGFSQALHKLSVATGYPVLAEATSQVRYAPELHHRRLESFDALLDHTTFQEHFQPEVIVRFGEHPTSRALARTLRQRPVKLYVISENGVWNDGDQAARAVYAADPTAFCHSLADGAGSFPEDRHWLDTLRRFDQQAIAVLQQALAPGAPFFEGHVAWLCVQLLPDDGILYIGNSRPVREVETFGLMADRMGTATALSNRGASGIDGLVSSALGAALAAGKPVLLYLGDMSLLHDLGGLAAAAVGEMNVTIVVVNNNGGGIFSYLPMADDNETFNRLFTMPHGFTFRGGAEMFGVEYTQAGNCDETRQAIETFVARPGVQLVEVTLDQAANVARHREIQAALAGALTP